MFIISDPACIFNNPASSVLQSQRSEAVVRDWAGVHPFGPGPASLRVAQERIPRTPGSLLLRSGSQQGLRQGHRWGPLQDLPLRRRQHLGNQRRGHAGTGKPLKKKYSVFPFLLFSQFICNVSDFRKMATYCSLRTGFGFIHPSEFMWCLCTNASEESCIESSADNAPFFCHRWNWFCH